MSTPPYPRPTHPTSTPPHSPPVLPTTCTFRKQNQHFHSDTFASARKKNKKTHKAIFILPGPRSNLSFSLFFFRLVSVLCSASPFVFIVLFSLIRLLFPSLFPGLFLSLPRLGARRCSRLLQRQLQLANQSPDQANNARSSATYAGGAS